MPLKLSLKPGEKFVLNGAVVQNGDRRSSLLLHHRAGMPVDPQGQGNDLGPRIVRQSVLRTGAVVGQGGPEAPVPVQGAHPFPRLGPIDRRGLHQRAGDEAKQTIFDLPGGLRLLRRFLIGL